MGSSQLPAAGGRRQIFFACYVIAMLLVFLLPSPGSPLNEPQHLDKVVHFGLFLGFALLMPVGRPSRGQWIILTSSLFAGAIELVQSILPYREGDWWDFAADAAGGGVGAALVLWRGRERQAAT